MTDTQIPEIDPDTAPNGDHSELPPPQQTKPPRASDHNAMFLRAARAGQLEQVLDFLRNGIDINTSNSNGLNALHLASKEGHNEVVRELIRRGATVDAATKKGNTALHIASLAGQDIIVTILVENGANVNAQSLNGFTPLYMSAQENHETVVRYLLAHGANQALATEDGFTPLAVALQQGHDRIVALLLENDNNSKIKLPALHIAAKKDDTRAATLLLQNEQNPNVTSKSGFTPLHIAAHYGNESIAELLLDKGANVNFQARHNISPLHVAAKWGRANLANLLLSRDATIDCRTRDLLTPLHCAARSGHEQVLDLLLDKGAPVDAKTKNGLAPLHMAAQGDHVDCARILLYHRANVDDVTVDYLTPLHVAAHCGHVRVAKLLLDRGANPNARALNGFTPLHIACKKNRNKVVELLLKYHASVEASTESGLSPLHVASFMGCINIVIFLIQQGANVDVETVRGETPLHLAARANQTDIVRVLVRNKANVDAKARELQTPLHIASRLGNTDIVVILLNANANANAATRDQYTPLHIAAKEGQEEVAVRLLDHHADKSLLTKKGFTPLHLASKYGNYEVAKLLLDRKTPVDIQGKNQVTPLHVAAHYNNERVAQLLLEKGASAKATAKNGYTPLHIAAKKNQMDIASGLLAYKADPNAESRAGFTPLHLASEEGHQEMGALLIEHGSHVNAQAKNGLTPLHLCAQEDRVNVAAELLNNRAEINAQTKAGYTPLHVACHFGQMNMVRFLIENGALVSAQTKANYTPLHQAAQQGHNNVVRYLLDNGASPNLKTTSGQTPLSIAQRLGYVSVVETLKTVTETTVITETTTITEERYNPQNPEAMNETMFSDSEDEVDEHQVATQDHAKDFNESITQGLRDTDVIHLIHTGEQAKTSPFDTTDADLEAVIKLAQNAPVTTAIPDPSFIENGHDDNVALTRDHLIQPSFLISFLVDARGGAMRGCRHSGVRVIIPPRKAAAPMRITCRYLKKEKLSHPPPLSEGEALASRVLEMGPHGAKFLGPVILEVPHFASLRGREREIVILRSDDGQHWKEHQLEATEDAVQEVLNESFDASELQQLDDLHTSRITRILTNDFPMYFAVVTRVRQEVHCVGPEGGVILSSVIPRVQAIFPDGSLTKTIKVSLQAQPVPNEIVTKLHGNRVAVSPIVTVEPRRRKFHKPITLCIPLPSTGHKGMLTQFANQQQAQEPPTLRLLCSITGGSSPAQWEDITGTTQLTFTGEDVSFTTTVSARFWLMDCQTPRDAARMAQEVYNEAISVPYMAKFVVFARRPFPIEGQLRLFCMTDDREDKTLEKQEGFVEVAKSRDVEVLSNRHQFLEFAGNLVPVTKSGDQLSVFFLPFQENRLAFNVKVRQSDSEDAAQAGRIAIMREAKIRAENIPPQHPICTLTITLPEYTGPLPTLRSSPVGAYKEDKRPINVKYSTALAINPADTDVPIEFVARKIGPDWPRLARTLQIPDSDVRQIKRELSSNGGAGQEPLTILKIWIHLKSTEATVDELQQALRKIGRDDIVQKLKNKNELDEEGDSLRLTDTPNLGRSTAFSSKGSLGATTAIAERQPVFNQQPSEPELTETKVVTRTERYVHHAEDGAPVVDERTVTRVFQDNAAVEERVVERQDLPLTEKEQQIWREGPGTPEQKRHLANSREAMIIDGEEQHLGDQVLKTTTLITQHHILDEPIETGSETAQGIISEPEPETEPDTTQATSLPESQPGEESESGPGIESDPGKWQHFETSGAESEALPPLEETSGVEGDRASPSTVEYQRQQEDVSPPVSVDSVIIRDEEEVVAQPTKAGDSLEHAAEAPPQPRDRRSISPGYEGEGEDTAEEGTSPTFDVPGTTKTDEDFEPTSSQQTNGTSATTASRRAPSLQQKETTDDGFANEDGSQVVSKRMTRTVTTSQSSVSGVDAAGNIIPTDEETASQKYRNGANGTSHVDETESVASDASLRSVRDRIAIFEALQESGHAHPYQPHPKPRLSIDSSASGKFSQPHEETMAEEFQPKTDEKPVSVIPPEVSPSAVTETKTVIQETEAGTHGSPPSVQSGIAEAEDVNIAYALRESGDVSAVPANQAWHTAGKQSTTGFEEHTDEPLATPQSEEEIKEKTQSGVGKMALAAGVAVVGTVTAGFIASEMESPGVPESEPVLHADIREVGKTGESITQHTQRDDKDVYDEDIVNLESKYESKSHTTEEHNFPQNYEPEGSVQEEECLISEKSPAEEKEYFRHDDAISEDGQYLHEQVTNKFEDEILPQHLEHDQSQVQEKNYLKEFTEEVHPEMVTDSHDVLTGGEVRLGQQEPVPEAVFAPADEDTEVKKHSESVISMMPGEGHWSRTVVEVAEQPAVNVYTAPLTEEGKQQERQTYSEHEIPESAAGEERYTKEIEQEWSPKEIEQSEETLAQKEIESSQNEPRLAEEEEHVGVDDTSGQKDLPKEYQTHENIEYQGFADDEDNTQYETERPIPLKIEEPIKQKHIEESILAHKREQEPHITSEYGSPVQENEVQFEKSEPIYGEEDKESINISYEDHGVSHVPESKPKSPHFDDYEQNDYGPESIKQQSEDKSFIQHEHVEHQIGEQESVPEAILVESHEHERQQRELEMPEETEATDESHFATEHDQPEIFLRESKDVLNEPSERKLKMSEEPFKQVENQPSAEVPSTVTRSPSSAMSFESQATVISAGKNHTYDEDVSVANNEEEGVITPASTPEATPGTVDRTRSLYEQEHYGDGMAVHTEICPPEHLQDEYKESEEETIVQPPETEETFEIQSQKSIEETSEGRETSQFENKSDQKSPIDESYTAQAFVKTEDDTEANIGDKESYGDEIATQESPKMPSSQVVLSYDLVEDQKSDEEHEMPHSEEIALASEERPQEVEIIIEAPEETTEEQWLVEKEEIIPQSEAVGQIEQEAQRAPSPEENELHTKSEKYEWDGQEAKKIPETEELIVDSTDVNYGKTNEYVTDRGEIPDYAYEEEPHQEAQAMEEDDDIMVESEEVAVPVQHDFPSELPDHARHEPFEKESHDDVSEESSGPEKVGEASQIEEFEPEHFGKHHEESIVDSAQVSAKRSDSFDLPKASSPAIPDQQEIESPIRESTYGEDEIKSDIEYSVDEGVIESENVPLHEEQAGSPLLSDIRRSSEAEFISEERCEKPHDEEFEENSKEEAQAMEEEEDIMVESEEVAVPVQHDFPSELPDHARHESFEKEPEDDVLEESSRKPEEANESPTLFSPTVTAYGDKDNIFDSSPTFEKESHDDVSEESSGSEKVGEASQIEEFEPEHFGKHHEKSIVDSAQISAKVANNEEEGVITPASTPGTVDRTRSLYEQEHYGDGMAVHTEICPPEHLQDEYKESEEETIVQPPETEETFEIQSQKSIEETSEGRETSQFENKSDQKSPIDESYTAQAFVKTEDDTEANIGDKESYGDEIATQESPKMPSSQVVLSYDLVEDQKSDEEHEMPHSEEIALASEERPQEVEIIIEAPEETTEEQWLVEKEEIIPQSEAVGQIEQEAQRAPSPEENELHTKSEKYEWDGQEAKKIPETEELIVDSTDVNYGKTNEYVTDRGEIPDYAYEEEPHQEAQAMEEDDDIMVESEEVAVPVQHDFPSELPDHARHEPFEKESHDDVSEESSGPEKVGEASQIEEFEPEHFGKHHEESIVDSAQVSAKRSDSFDLPKASSPAIPDQQEIESPIRESTYGEDEIKSDIEYSVDEGVIESENVPLHEEQAGSPLLSDIRRSSEAEFISEERCEKPHDEEFEENSKEEAQAMEEEEDIMVESEEVAVPVQHDFPSELPDHARHESFEKEPEDDVLEESSRKPEEANESPTMFSPTVTAYGDKDNIFDISRSPTPPPYKETDLMTQSVYGKIHDENPVEAEMHPSQDIMTQSMYKEQVHEVDRPLSEQDDEELVSNYELIEAAELQKESPSDPTDIENRIKSTSPPPLTQDDKKQRTPEAESKEYESEFYVVDEKDLETMDKEGFQRLQSEEIIEAQAVDLVDDVLQNIAYEAQEEKALGRERSIDEEVADAEIRRVSATQLTPADGSLSPATSLGLPGAGDLFSRPKSPVPPRAAEAVVTSGSPQEEQAKTGPGSTESLPGNVDSAGSSPSISSLQRRKDQQLAIAADNLSEGSLQEFERLEQEIQLRRGSGASGGSPNGGIPAAEEKLILIQSAGSLNSLQEFENLEKEVGVHETTQAQPPEGIGAEDVMMLSDIREESDEAEEMSTREDDEDEESSADIVPSLPPIADQEVPKDDYQHQLDASAYAQEAMLCSIDSLEAGRQPHAGTEYDHHLMETSVDSLEAGIIHGSELVQHEREKSDSVIDNISQDSRNQPHSQETGMSADTDTTFQEYQEDEGDKDSLDGVVQSYPTTLTTFETIQTKDDGTTETITRRVLTRVTDPVHSRVRFTGTDSEDQLRNISTEPIESVDEEGNITTIRRQTIH